MNILLNQVLYTVVATDSQTHRCGKTTTQLVIRNSTTDISIVAEGTQEQVFERLGIKVQE